MAKKALVNKANKKPKFKVRGIRAVTVAVVRTRCSASSDSAVSACARWRTQASSPEFRSRAGDTAVST